MNSVFVTGMQRSGTTLLEKLLCCHPRISILSQPFPLLFIEVKRRFLRQLGEVNTRYPLGDLFLEDRYGEQDLRGFLSGLFLGAPDLRAVVEQMAGFPGRYSSFAPKVLEETFARLEPGDLASTLVQLYRSLAPRPDAAWFGAKETLWEEALPFLLDRGFACLLILRDPRGVLASLNHGEGLRHGGALKPTLFNLRNWRKSAAFALHLEDRPGFLCLRYEDLVTSPYTSLDRIANLLDVEPFDERVLDEGIRDQSGQVWEGNSSHGAFRGIASSSAERYVDLLAPAVSRYVEATCWPELHRLGYPVELEWSEVPQAIRGFADPYEVTRPELRGYADDPSRAAEELRRCELLEATATREAVPFFLFADVLERLREVLPA